METSRVLPAAAAWRSSPAQLRETTWRGRAARRRTRSGQRSRRPSPWRGRAASQALSTARGSFALAQGRQLDRVDLGKIRGRAFQHLGHALALIAQLVRSQPEQSVAVFLPLEEYCALVFSDIAHVVVLVGGRGQH